jgi:hypothetical protein
MASKINENSSSKGRGRKAASTQSPTVVEPRQNVVPINTPAVRHLDNNIEDQIRRRAYELYLERGGTPGNENEDWLVAEQQVRSRQLEQAG